MSVRFNAECVEHDSSAVEHLSEDQRREFDLHKWSYRQPSKCQCCARNAHIAKAKREYRSILVLKEPILCYEKHRTANQRVKHDAEHISPYWHLSRNEVGGLTGPPPGGYSSPTLGLPLSWHTFVGRGSTEEGWLECLALWIRNVEGSDG